MFVFAVIVPKFMEEVVTFKASMLFNVCPGASAVPVVLSWVRVITVAIHLCPLKLDDESVACAKYWTAKVVVAFCVPPAQLLEAVNAVAT